jgi:hypothetical protein
MEFDPMQWLLSPCTEGGLQPKIDFYAAHLLRQEQSDVEKIRLQCW